MCAMIKDVMVRLTKRKGKGVFARKNFYKGEIIFRNPRGKLVNKKDFTKLSGDDQEHLNEINKTTSEIMKPPGRFVNHSCAPNSIPTEFEENASYVALKDIKKGEEITVDYRINAHDGNIWRCYCGSRICSKKIKSDFLIQSYFL